MCLAYGQEWSVYAVGSQAHVSFLDPRQPSHNVKSVCSKERGSGKKPVKDASNGLLAEVAVKTVVSQASNKEEGLFQ